MKLLGHVYVATQSFPENNQHLLAFGALTPETVFYTDNPILSFDQVHEGGLEIYKFCMKYNPAFSDLGLGIMTHSVKYGADSYNSLESIKPLGFTDKDIPRIADALGVSTVTANARAHNLYDLVLDYHINSKYPAVSKIVEQTKTLDKHAVASVLSKSFSVPEDKVYNNLLNLWDKYDLNLMTSFEGLAIFWKSLSSNLKEKDPVNIAKTAALLSEFYSKAESSADIFIENVINSTRFRVKQAIGS